MISKQGNMYVIAVMLVALLSNMSAFCATNEFAWGSEKVSPNMMCGTNCLWQICKVAEINCSLGAISNYIEMTPEKGASLGGMVRGARKLGFQAEAVKTDIVALESDRRIAILLLTLNDFGHYVLLDKIEGDDIRLLDSDKFRTISRRDLSSIWSGTAILIGENTANKDVNLKKNVGYGVVILGAFILLSGSVYLIKTHSLLFRKFIIK